MRGPVEVEYEAYVLSTRIPFRYLVTLHVNGIPTGVGTKVWLLKRAREVMQHMVDHGNDLLNQYGVAAEIAAEIYAMKREEELAKVKVGDRVKLLVDIGQYKKGRVCRVAEITEPSFYEARGAIEWVDERYPVLVVPIRANGDSVALGPKDAIPLARGEFAPINEDIDDDD